MVESPQRQQQQPQQHQHIITNTISIPYENKVFSPSSLPPPVPPPQPRVQQKQQQLLRLCANYNSFHPTALAIYNNYKQWNSTNTTIPNNNAVESKNDYFKGSLGAIAGHNGILLFHTTSPQEPTLILNYTSPSSNSGSVISSLAFPNENDDGSSNNNLLLAAGKGSSVILWDVSGHVMSPLLDRIQHNTTTTSNNVSNCYNNNNNSSTNNNNNIVSCIKWRKQSNARILLTTYDKEIYAWDIRTRQSTLHNNKPSHRFTPSSNNMLLHVDSNENHEIATIDTCGHAYIFDDRYDSSSNTSASVVSSFQAYDYTGIGISSSHNSEWITWGCDYNNNNNDDMTTTVKCWSKQSTMNINSIYSDYYWAENITTKQEEESVNDSVAANEYHKIHTFDSSPYTCCARVSPFPYSNTFVTIADIPSTHTAIGSTSTWEAQVWNTKDITTSDTNSSKNNIVPSRSRWNDIEDANCLKDIIGRGYDKGILIAAELSIGLVSSSSLSRSFSSSYGAFDSSGIELQLCCLSDTGYITIYGIPDAEDVTQQKSQQPQQGSNITHYDNLPNSNDKITATTNNNNNNATNESSLLPHKQLKKSPAITASEDYGIDVEELLLQIDKEHHLGHTATTTMNSYYHHSYKEEQQPQHMNISAASGAGNHSSNNTDTNNINIKSTIKKQQHIPCPRLCGASFSAGGYGGLIVFHNGSISKKWSSYKKQQQTTNNDDNVSLTSLASQVIQQSIQVEQQLQLHQLSLSSYENINNNNNNNTTNIVYPLRQMPYSTPRTMYDFVQMNSHANQNENQPLIMDTIATTHDECNATTTMTLSPQRKHSSVVCYTNRYDHLFVSPQSFQLQQKQRQSSSSTTTNATPKGKTTIDFDSNTTHIIEQTQNKEAYYYDSSSKKKYPKRTMNQNLLSSMKKDVLATNAITTQNFATTSTTRNNNLSASTTTDAVDKDSSKCSIS